MLPDEIEADFDLEKIDTEIRLEKIRQSASKLTWEGFGVLLKRNLMEKRIVLDADSRIDVIQALAIMRKSLPVDEKADVPSKLRQLADSLECNFSGAAHTYSMRNAELYIEVTVSDSSASACSLGVFGRAMQPAPQLAHWINKDQWPEVRAAVHRKLCEVPAMGSSSQERVACVESLEVVRRALQGGDVPTVREMNDTPTGWLRAATATQPARLYIACEPTLGGEGGVVEEKTLPDLFHCEVLIAECDKETELPADPSWQSTRSVRAAVCLRFSRPLVLTQHSLKKLHPLLARAPVVLTHLNLYAHIAAHSVKDGGLLVRTKFPDDKLQHEYEVSVEALKDECDVAIGEVLLKDARAIDKVVCVLRTQLQHNSMWESVVAACYGKRRAGRGCSAALSVKLTPTPRRYEAMFAHKHALYVARVEYSAQAGWRVIVETADGESAGKECDRKATEMLLKSWSLPVALNAVFFTLAVPADLPALSPPPLNTRPHCFAAHSSAPSKVGSAWLPRNKMKEGTTHADTRGSTGGFRLELEGRGEGGGLLALLAEPDEALVGAAGAGAGQQPGWQAQARTTNRAPSDTSLTLNAFSDLEAICRLASESVDDGEEQKSPALLAGAGRPHHLPQLSPLDAARGKMAQSLSASNLQMMGQQQQHMQQYGAGPGGMPGMQMGGMPGMGMGGMYPSPSPLSVSSSGPMGTPMSMGGGGGHSTPGQLGPSPIGGDVFAFDDGSGSGSPFHSPNYFGQYGGGTPSPRGGTIAKRRGRGRKSANMGDRTPSADGSVTAGESPDPTGAKKARGGKPAQRRPRGARKNSMLPAGSGVGEQRPPLLHRSNSDLMMGVGGSTPAMGSPFLEEDDSDDEETDPPPPPKALVGTLSGGPPPPAAAAPLPSPVKQPLPPTPNLAQQLIASTAQPPTSDPLVNPLSHPLLQPQPPQLAQQAPPTQAPPTLTSQATIERPQTMVGQPPARKSSLEAVIGKLKAPPLNAPTTGVTPGGSSQPPKRAMMSDLYDDGTGDSPPPPPAQATPDTTPRASSSEKEGSSGGGGGGNKIILKIPKTSSARSSPSVDTSRSKGVLPKGEGKEKERSREEKERRRSEKEKAKKAGSDERVKKRKADDKDRKEDRKEHKKHKTSGAGLEKSPAPSATPVMPFQIGSLKNFKIPKKEEQKSDAPTTPGAGSGPPAGGPFSSGDREREREKERDRDREREKSGSSGSAKPKSILKGSGSSSSSSSRPSGSSGRKPPLLPDPKNRSSSSSSSSHSSRPPTTPGPQTAPAGLVPPPGNRWIPPIIRTGVPLPPGAPPGSLPMPPGHAPLPPTAVIPVAPPTQTPPTVIPTTPRSPSPDPNAMVIDDSPASPEDEALRIADD